MRAPRRKLRGAFVLVTIAFIEFAWAGPQIRKGDCGILGDAAQLVPEPRPSNEPEVPLKAGDVVRFKEQKDDRVLVEQIPFLSACSPGIRTGIPPGKPGWIASASVRYVRLLNVRGVSGLVVMPEQLKAFGKVYTSTRICGNNLFTEEASFYFTGDAKFPLAVLCTGQLDGEPNTLSVLGPKEKVRSKALEPKESSSSIDDPTLVKELGVLIGTQSQ